MTVAYAMTDLAPDTGRQVDSGTVSVPVSSGGCGRQHDAVTDDRGRPYIDCAEGCADYLVSNHHGWAAHPTGVPLTPDEMSEVALSQREGEVSYRLAMKAMGEAVGNLVQGHGNPAGAAPAPAPVLSLKEQLASLSHAERAELAGLLAPEPDAKRPAARKPANT